jgi:hypothetical protein
LLVACKRARILTQTTNKEIELGAIRKRGNRLLTKETKTTTKMENGRKREARREGPAVRELSQEATSDAL